MLISLLKYSRSYWPDIPRIEVVRNIWLCHELYMSIIYKPTTGPDCWKSFLAMPDLHWKTGRSAKSMAHAWEHYKGLPPRIASALSKISNQIEPLLVVPEYKVALPGGGRESQNDAFLLARLGEKTASIMIEGKVSETFGPDINRGWRLKPTTR